MAAKKCVILSGESCGAGREIQAFMNLMIGVTIIADNLGLVLILLNLDKCAATFWRLRCPDTSTTSPKIDPELASSAHVQERLGGAMLELLDWVLRLP